MYFNKYYRSKFGCISQLAELSRQTIELAATHGGGGFARRGQKGGHRGADALEWGDEDDDSGTAPICIACSE